MSRILRSLISGVFLAAFFQASGAESQEASQQSAGVRGSPLPGLPNIGVEQGLNSAGRVESLLVYQGQQQVQTLDVCTEEPVPRQGKVGTLATADYNFDGYPDLALQATDVKDNSTFCVWLFDPGTQRFVPSSQLSQLVNAVPDPKTRTVVSTKYPGCPSCYEREVFRWSQGQLEPVRDESLTLDPLSVGYGGCDYVHTVKEVKDGRMKETDRERTNSFGTRCGNDM
jgi:hypothetical protein